MNFDTVVVGSGIAGLSFAIKMAKLGHKVAIFTKKERSDTNTNHAQGGIASVTSGTDNFDMHVRDTLIAGDGPEKGRLTALAAELGVERQVCFAGWISGGMDRFYSALDINALTSLSETFPYALTDYFRLI